MKHVTNLYADVTQSDPVLGIGSLAVEESDSISVFIEKKNEYKYSRSSS